MNLYICMYLYLLYVYISVCVCVCVCGVCSDYEEHCRVGFVSYVERHAMAQLVKALSYSSIPDGVIAIFH